MTKRRDVKPCPKCRSHKTQSVSGVVAAGTNLRTGLDMGVSPTLGTGGLGVSFMAGGSVREEQTLLVQQLSCPKKELKGYDMRLAGLVLTLALAVILIAIYQEWKSLHDQENAGLITPTQLPELQSKTAMLVVVGVLFLISLTILVIGQIRLDMEAAAARLLWERLYYCPREHLAYVGTNPTMWVPATDLKRCLASPTCRRTRLSDY